MYRLLSWKLQRRTRQVYGTWNKREAKNASNATHTQPLLLKIVCGWLQASFVYHHDPRPPSASRYTKNKGECLRRTGRCVHRATRVAAAISRRSVLTCCRCLATEHRATTADLWAARASFSSDVLGQYRSTSQICKNRAVVTWATMARCLPRLRSVAST
jgi:hypothetical protein